MFTYNRDYTVYTRPTDYSEIVRIIDDSYRSGFENLGSGDNLVARGPSTIDLKINAQGGRDIIDLGSFSSAAQGNHTVHGGTGDDGIATGSGNDTIYAGSDHDTAEGGLGSDVIHGGFGNDHLYGDSLSAFNGGGADQLFGGSGDDVLAGMSGADELTGGTGKDTFEFFNAQVSTMAARDAVLDFNPGERDQFDFSLLDGNSTLSGRQPLDFETAPSTRAGTIWAEGSGTDWTVFVNLNGGAPDMAVDVTLAGGATSILETDFIL